MGATNHTTYYELSQFIGTDKPAWLQDYNGDMTKIDAGIKEAKNAADDADTAASNAQGDATDALNAIETINTTLGTIEDTLGTATGNISTINSLIGNGTPTTSDQTIIGAINGIEGAIAPREDGDDLANSYAIGDQFARGGSVYTALTPLTANTPFASLTLNTDYKVSDTLTEQISDVKDAVESIPNGYVIKEFATVIQVTADGVKTYQELYKELADAVVTKVSSMADDEILTIIDGTFYGGGAKAIRNTFFSNTDSSFNLAFSKTSIESDGKLYIPDNRIDTTLGTAHAYRNVIDPSDNSVTFTDNTSSVPTSGNTFNVRVQIFKAI